MYFDTRTIKRLQGKRSKIKLIIDRIFFPLIILLDTKNALRLGLTPLDEERIICTYNNLEGKVLDIGCGENILIKAYGNGIGVDVHPWEGIDILLKDTSILPFKDNMFDCVTFVASLNHIPNRNSVLKEVNRVLKPSGKLLITMITPFVSKISHKLRYKYDPDQSERGMKDGEVYGFTKLQIQKLLNEQGYKVLKIVSFYFG